MYQFSQWTEFWHKHHKVIPTFAVKQIRAINQIKIMNDDPYLIVLQHAEKGNVLRNITFSSFY